MSKPSIFISCGQYTDSERELGKSIARMVRATTELEPFFAEEVQDLNGLDTNILNALRNCVGFITVLHPRGTIEKPDGSRITRASLWIEQEIAIATYIQRVEKRPLPIIAFRHSSVSREGIRDLLHLNPIEFTNEMEVLTALPERLRAWKALTPTGIQLQLASEGGTREQDHVIRMLRVTVLDDTPRPIVAYHLRIEVHGSLLKHWSASYAGEVTSPVPNLRRFEFNQQSYGPVAPRSSRSLFATAYCSECALRDLVVSALVAETEVRATLWVDGNEYVIRKTTQEMAADASRRGQY